MPMPHNPYKTMETSLVNDLIDREWTYIYNPLICKHPDDIARIEKIKAAVPITRSCKKFEEDMHKLIDENAGRPGWEWLNVYVDADKRAGLHFPISVDNILRGEKTVFKPEPGSVLEKIHSSFKEFYDLIVRSERKRVYNFQGKFKITVFIPRDYMFDQTLSTADARSVVDMFTYDGTITPTGDDTTGDTTYDGIITRGKNYTKIRNDTEIKVTSTDVYVNSIPVTETHTCDNGTIHVVG